MRKVLFPIVVLLTVACTVGLYYLLFDEVNTLFYLNTIVTCVAEVLLLMNVPIWSGKKMFNVTSVTVSRSVNVYAVAIFLWTLFYTLAIHDEVSGGFKTYYIGMLIATLIFVVVCGVSTVGAGTAEKMSKEVQTAVDNRKNVVQFVRVSAADLSSSIESDNSEWKDETEKLLKMIADKVATMPAEKLYGNPDVARRIEDSMSDIALVGEQFASAEDKEAVKADLTSKLNRLNKYITTIKTL
jgi:hypothetical protein